MTQSSEPFYRAFISYSHADRAQADWLHRALESYRIPSKLVGRTTAVGLVPRRMGPIFRDREELAASSDLSRELESALLASHFLIVIASPAAASSRWVNEEIRLFKQHRGEDRVLAVIASGSPRLAASDSLAHDECFPEALRFRVDAEGKITDIPAEPIAADLRPQGDGERVAKLKIAAGLTGLKLDDLVQREAQRRTRRLAVVAAFASVLAIVMTTLTVMAVNARVEAERRRAEADGLVEYMLTDLRSKLEPVGRLEIMDSVGARALSYYAGQDPGDLDADALGRRARALHLVGEVANLRGKLDTALATFRQAAATTSEQLRRDPGNGQRIFDHAQSVYWIGYVAWQRGDIATARKYLGQYLGHAQQLAALDDRKPEWDEEVGNAYANLGVLELDDNRLPAALNYFENAQRASAALLEKSAEKREHIYQIAQAYAWKADVRRKMRNPAGALSDRIQEVSLYRTLLAADAEDSKAKEGLSVAWLRIAQLHLETGKLSKALEFANASQGEIERLRLSDPSNSLWQEMAVKSANVRTEALMMLSDWPGAHRSNQLALNQAKQLVSTDSSVAEWRSDCLMPARWMEIAISNAQGDYQAARGKIEAFEHEFRTTEKPRNDEERLARLMVRLLSGMNWQSSGNKLRAISDFAQAKELLSDTETTDPRATAAAAFLKSISATSALAAKTAWTSDYDLSALFRTERR